VVVSLGILVLRRTEPNRPRPFRTPWVPFLPLLAAAGAFGLMAALPGATWIRFLIWLAIGLVVYFAYSRQHSRVGRASG
jgi:APA family basic amino acid/polyamine antiporter